MNQSITIEELNKLTAYEDKCPIATPLKMTKQIECEKLNEEQLHYIENMFWSTNFKGDVSELEPILQGMLKMRDLILTFGGEQVCMPFIENDIDKIMKRGQLWHGDRIRMQKMKKRSCHSNSSVLWKRNRDERKQNLFLATGYAVSEDGIWRQHSWCIDTSSIDTKVIETTLPRVAYFGFVLTDEEAEVFFEENSD